jgi:hypothetical protein
MTMRAKRRPWIPGTEADRFAAYTHTEPNTGCWLWSGATTPDGYGIHWIGGTYVLAHRKSFLDERGAIQPGLQLDHLCRQRCCINPWHLEPVTSSINTRRGVSPAAVNAKRTHCVRGHELTGQNIYLWRGKRLCRTCRKRIGNEYNQRRRS